MLIQSTSIKIDDAFRQTSAATKQETPPAANNISAPVSESISKENNLIIQQTGKAVNEVSTTKQNKQNDHTTKDQNSLPNILNTRFEFKFDEKTKEMVVQIIDKKTDKVIRQIPPEEFLKIKMAFKELMRGTLLDKKA